MIDLHMHSVNSDGTCTTEELLQQLVELNAEIISFTDHDSVGCYFDLNDIYIKHNIPIKIVHGVELSFLENGVLRDMLGYGIDVKIINNWLNTRYSKEYRIAKQRKILTKFKEICRNKGMKFSNDLDICTGNKSEAFVVMYKELINYPTNREAFPFITNNTVFYWQYFANKSSEYYVDETDGLPTMKDVIDIIHKSGGYAFLAHPCAYKLNRTEVSAFIDIAIKNGINGIEVKHSSNKDDDVPFLRQIAEINNLYISGGSDFHGSTKPGLNLIVGYDNMLVTKDDIGNWINSVESTIF